MWRYINIISYNSIKSIFSTTNRVNGTMRRLYTMCMMHKKNVFVNARTTFGRWFYKNENKEIKKKFKILQTNEPKANCVKAGSIVQRLWQFTVSSVLGLHSTEHFSCLAIVQIQSMFMNTVEQQSEAIRKREESDRNRYDWANKEKE